MPDTQGLTKKYLVKRADGRDTERQKHHGCRYFVLDITHADQHVRKALRAFAESVHAENPVLASDLRQWLVNGPCGLCGGAGCDEGCGYCQMAYVGPDSHKVCRRCHGAGTTAQNDGSGAAK